MVYVPEPNNNGAGKVFIALPSTKWLTPQGHILPRKPTDKNDIRLRVPIWDTWTLSGWLQLCVVFVQYFSYIESNQNNRDGDYVKQHQWRETMAGPVNSLIKRRLKHPVKLLMKFSAQQSIKPPYARIKCTLGICWLTRPQIVQILIC